MRTALHACISRIRGRSRRCGSCGGRLFTAAGPAGAAERDAAAPLMLVPWLLRRLGISLCLRGFWEQSVSSDPVYQGNRHNRDGIILCSLITAPCWLSCSLLPASVSDWRAIARQCALALCMCSVVPCRQDALLAIAQAMQNVRPFTTLHDLARVRLPAQEPAGPPRTTRRRPWRRCRSRRAWPRSAIAGTRRWSLPATGAAAPASSRSAGTPRAARARAR